MPKKEIKEVMIKVKADNKCEVIRITEKRGKKPLSTNPNVESGHHSREYTMDYHMLKSLLLDSIRGLELNIKNHPSDDLSKLTERLIARVYHLTYLIGPFLYGESPIDAALATANKYGLTTLKKIMKMSDSERNKLIEQNKEEEKGIFADDSYISILGEDISYSLLSMLIRIGCRYMFMNVDIESSISEYPITGNIIIHNRSTQVMFFSNLLISNSVNEAMVRTLVDTQSFN